MIFLNSEKELLRTAVNAVIDKKACDTEIIRVSDLTSVSDYFVICTGTSDTHVKALCDAVEKAAAEKLSVSPLHIEGYNEGNWVLLDYGSVIIHIFLAETRRFYSIERLWSSAPKIEPDELIEKTEAGV